MKIREEFVLRALEPHANMAELCREFGISRKTGYKWLERFKENGVLGLKDTCLAGHTVRRYVPLVTLCLSSSGCVARTIARILERVGETRRGRSSTRLDRPTDAPSKDVSECNERWTLTPAIRAAKILPRQGTVRHCCSVRDRLRRTGPEVGAALLVSKS